MNITKEQQELLNTEFPAEIEKLAAAQVQEMQELISYGIEKAAEAAQEKDEEDEEEKKNEEKTAAERVDLTEEQIKEAHAKGGFIAEGYLSGLIKEGSERHGDPLHYLYDDLAVTIEKHAGVDAASAKTWLRGIAEKVKDYHKGAVGDMKHGLNHLKGQKDSLVKTEHSMGKTFVEKKDNKEGLKSLGKGVAKLSPHLLALGGAGYLGAKALKGKKEE